VLDRFEEAFGKVLTSSAFEDEARDQCRLDRTCKGLLLPVLPSLLISDPPPPSASPIEIALAAPRSAPPGLTTAPLVASHVAVYTLVSKDPTTHHYGNRHDNSNRHSRRRRHPRLFKARQSPQLPLPPSSPQSLQARQTDTIVTTAAATIAAATATTRTIGQ
jgi:hypothetical protein